MLSIPRVLGVVKLPCRHPGCARLLRLQRNRCVQDTELMQTTMYPVEELSLLRGAPLAQKTEAPLAPGLTPLAGVNSQALDLEVTFDYSATRGQAIPADGTRVGVAVLCGQNESTEITFRLTKGLTKFVRATAAALALVSPTVLRLSFDHELSC